MTETRNECKELNDSNGSAIRDALKQLEDAVGNMQCALFDEDERKTRYLTEKLCDLEDEIENFKAQNTEIGQSDEQSTK